MLKDEDICSGDKQEEVVWCVERATKQLRLPVAE